MELYLMILDRWAMDCLLEDAERCGDEAEAAQLRREMQELDKLIEAAQK